MNIKRKNIVSMSYFFSIIFITAYISVQGAPAATTSSIAGKVIDSASGEPIIGVNIIIPEQKIFTSSDVNGRYLLKGVPAGRHRIIFQIMGYAKNRATVTVKPNRRINLNLSMSYLTGREVVVTGKRISNTEAALLRHRKKAAVAQDAISSEQISKTPDSDASEAVKRITGITMDSNNRVIIRGLAERYSSTMFARSIIPSPDPDRRIVPMDIFPVGLLDNIVVIKAYTPDLPGEFCGGVVQINPKDYPEDFRAKVSSGIGFHIETVGKKFWTYKGGKWDWLGIDDGARKKPEELDKYGLKNLNLGNSIYPDIFRQKIGMSVKNIYTPEKKLGYPSGKFGFFAGDSLTIKEKFTLGIIVSGILKTSFKNRTTKYTQITGSFDPQKIYNIEDSKYSTTKGLLLSLGFSTKNNKIRLTAFYTHNSKDSTKVTKGYNRDRQESSSGIDLAKYYQLQNVINDLLFIQMSTKHNIRKLNTAIDLNASYSRASRNEPDTRNIQLVDAADAGTPGVYELYRSDDTRRYWLDHLDWIGEFSGSLTYKFKQWSGIYSKIKIGGGMQYRERESEKRSFQWENDGTIGWTNPHEPLEYYFSWPFIVGTNTPSDSLHYYLKETTASNDKYTGELLILNGFGMIDIPIIKQIRLVAGARYEFSDMDLEAWDPTYSMNMKLRKNPLKYDNVMPGACLTYTPIDDLNIRMAFSKTLARPDFRETIEFKYRLMSKDAEIKGNPDLKQTDIYNYDFRTEWFPSDKEIVAASFFYKYLVNPIELLEKTSTAGTDLYTFKNASHARNIGCELELRKELYFGIGKGKIKGLLKSLFLNLNATYIYSVIKVKCWEDKENVTSLNELIDITLYTTKRRPLQAQSPWIVNTGIEYSNDRIGLTTSFMFNIFGGRIVRVGTIRSWIPFGDVYEKPWPKLDFIVRQKILKYGEIKLTISNIIDPYIKQTQEIIHSSYLFKTTITKEKYKLGRNIGLSYGYTF